MSVWRSFWRRLTFVLLILLLSLLWPWLWGKWTIVLWVAVWRNSHGEEVMLPIRIWRLLVLSWGSVDVDWARDEPWNDGHPSWGGNCILWETQGQMTQLTIPDCLFINFYWSIVDLQCCVGFRYTAKWFNYTSTLFLRFFFHIDHYRVLSSIPYVIQ